jgi:membrane peptidoglycan carboxypeptidase
LREAAALGTAATGKVIQPFIVESVLDRDGQLIRPQTGAFSEIDLPLNDLGFRRSKMLEIRQALRKVLLPGGTGYFFTDKGMLQYLGNDNPETLEVNEAESRKDDFGKSGTADYGASEPFQDSLFVYRHGGYVIAVWLEKADRGEESDAGQRAFERHPAHKLADRIVHLLESLEHSHE